MTAGTSEAAEVNAQEVAVALAQYRECSAHHIHFMTLIWQVPAVTIGISGALVAATFGYDVDDGIRALITLLGAIFMLSMTLAVERYRMFQLRRRKDMSDIENELTPVGARQIVWSGSEIAVETRRGDFRAPGLYLYRWEGFKFLRVVMYAVTITLLVLSAVALGDAIT